MLTPDLINGSFEALAGVAVLNHCFALYRDKQVRGLSVLSVAFFTLWGFWNLFYYPHLGQFWSFAGGVFITLVNIIYVGMLWHYLNPGQRALLIAPAWRLIGGLVCRFKGHDYRNPVFRTNCLYLCHRCGREMFDRTLDDLRAMRPMDDDELEELHREIQMEANP